MVDTTRRVTQAGLEVLTNAGPSPAVTQAGLEVLTNTFRGVDLTQLGLELLVLPRVARAPQPGSRFEIAWDGVTWVDETAHVRTPVSCDYGIVAQGGSLATLGEGPIGRLTVTLDNSDGRYSVTRAGSQAQVNGLYQKPARFSAGYWNFATEEWDLEVIFTGRIQSAPADERDASIQLTCYSHDFDIQQQRPSTLAHRDKCTDELVAILANEISFTATDLERGYVIVPYWYADGDDCLAEMREIAEAELGIVWVDPQDATLKFWRSDHWVDAAQAGLFGRSTAENVRLRHDYTAAYDTVVVHYQPRVMGRLMTVHTLVRPIIVPPQIGATPGSVTETLKFRYPLALYDSVEYHARHAGGVNMTEWLGFGPAEPRSAREWEVTFSNSNTVHALIVDRFDVIGYPIEGLPSRKHERARATLAVPRRTDVMPRERHARYTIQLPMHAHLIADLESHRLQDPPLVFDIGPVPLNQYRRVGDVVRLSLDGGISQAVADVVLLYRHVNCAERYEEWWTCCDVSALYEYLVSSKGAEDGYFRVGTSQLSVGRLYY